MKGLSNTEEPTPFEKQRRRMVEEQLIRRGIRDSRVLRVMGTLPREHFVPEQLQRYAYYDGPLEIGAGQTISQPYMVALMTEALELRGDERVLEIGTGSGYQTAVLASLVYEVYTIERIRDLQEEARKRLTALGLTNVHFRVGDGSLGWSEASPFDRILVTAAVPDLPPPLKQQLKVGGILVAPVGPRWGQVLIRWKKQGEPDQGSAEELTDCAFVPLVGRWGYREG